MKKETSNTSQNASFFQKELENFNKATFEMLEKSDRVRVVLLGAEVDRILQFLLKSYLVPKDQKRDLLFDSTSTFSGRIELGFRIGLLKPEWLYDLRIVNIIRDDFAHGGVGLHLELPKFRDLCFQLKIGQKWIEDGKYAGSKGDNAPTRFVSTCVVLTAHLCIAGMNLKSLIEPWRQYSEDAVSIIGENEQTE